MELDVRFMPPVHLVALSVTTAMLAMAICWLGREKHENATQL